MNMRSLNRLCAVLPVLFLMQVTTNLQAKGLDELKPEDTKNAGEDGKPSEGVEAEGANPENVAKENPEEEKAPKLTFTREGAAYLNDKAFLEVSYGIIRASASEGDWRASGMTDLSFKYKLREGSWELFAQARYAPFDVTVYDQQVGYRGTVNAYYLGAESKLKFQKSWYASADAELGLMAVYLNNVADVGSNPDLEKNGANVSIGLGAGRQLWDYLWIGPKVHLGFGRFSTFQFSVASALMF